ncbi:RAD55 family ATPase [Halosimplex sp. TS25]|uniref:RAD55 family ATPase n=1 Tax=Halosimplex rarum TaxID=3396619 RepID=UPI0039ECB941
MPLSTGCERLDALLGGGVPSNRSLLVSGPPGTGKTTLGMQFLQAGLDAGEDCLFVSTEQTLGELRDTLDPYPFDLDAENLTVITVHAEPGETMERDDDLVFRTLDGGDRAVTEWFNLPFSRENVVHYLSDHSPKDRILLDSLSGLRPIAADRISFWRSTYDLIRLFSDDFGATSLLTAGAGGDDRGVAGDLLQYGTHGVVRLSWRERNNQRHRFLRVAKLRGHDHDDRLHKLVLGDDGATVRPTQRTPPTDLLHHEHLSTGVPALDDLLGGGLVRGGLTVFSHDGTTGYYAINARLLAAALEEGMALAVTLPAGVSLAQLDRYWTDGDWSVDGLLDDDRLFVLELVESAECDHRNVICYDEDERDWQAMMELSYERSGDRPLFAFVDTEPLLEQLSPRRVRHVRYRAAARHTDEEDVVVYTVNPAIQDRTLVEFFVDASRQTLRIERADDGVEWLTLRKSPTGAPGTSAVVDYAEKPPYVDLV